MIATCPALLDKGCSGLHKTLDRWQRCDDEFGVPVEKLMLAQSKSRHILCPSDLCFHSWKQIMLTHNMTSKDMESFILSRKDGVGLSGTIPSHFNHAQSMLLAVDCSGGYVTWKLQSS